MVGDSCGGLEAAVAKRAARAVDAVAVASEVVTIWRDIDKALSSVIGTRGTAALFQRSAHQTATQHPWLASMSAGVQTAIAYADFERLIGQQTTAEAAAAAAAQVRSICELLGSLIGVDLTERLLRAVRTRLEAESSPQEALP